MTPECERCERGSTVSEADCPEYPSESASPIGTDPSECQGWEKRVIDRDRVRGGGDRSKMNIRMRLMKLTWISLTFNSADQSALFLFPHPLIVLSNL